MASKDVDQTADQKESAPANGSTQEKTVNVPTIKAYKNPDFLNSPVARHIRIMCEVQEPQRRMQEHGIDNYVLVLGSHLVMHPEERKKQIAELEQKMKAGGPRDELEALGAKIRFSQSLQKMDTYYTIAMELGEKIGRWSEQRRLKGLPTYHVCTGGGPGIMEAANRGARSAGAATLGIGSTRPEWGTMNKFVSEEVAFEFHYFFMRKFWMAYKCMGLVVLPGGYGSLDELFELLSLVSSKKITHNLPIVLLGSEHWKKTINFDYLVECSMLSKESVELLVYLDTAQDCFEYLVEQFQRSERSGENDVVEVAKRRRLSKNSSNAAPKGE